jgi:hypothetical protein
MVASLYNNPDTVEALVQLGAKLNLLSRVSIFQRTVILRLGHLTLIVATLLLCWMY